MDVMNITLTGLADATKMLRVLGKDQVPYATARALTDTAYDARAAIIEEMQQVFDRPTPYTLRAFIAWRADKKHWPNMRAGIEENSMAKGQHYLKVQGTGGGRPKKGDERLLSSRLGTDIGAYIPVGAARIDQFGNWSNGERSQVMSALKARRDVGYTSNQTATSRKRNPKRAEYFVPKVGSNLPPGVYKREGDNMEQVLAFTMRAPKYKKRIDFHDVAMTRARKVYTDHFNRRLSEAIASATGRQIARS